MKVSQCGIFKELWKFLQVQSRKSSSAMMKLALMRTATGKEDPELPLLSRISSLELPASAIAAQKNASQSSSNRHISTSTVQRRLRESRLHGWIAAKKWLLKDTSKKKRLAWAKKHEQWTLDWWNLSSGLISTNLRFLVFVKHRVGEWMISTCVVPTMKHGGGVMVWGCFAGDTVRDLFRIQCTLYQHGYHSILQRYAILSGLRLVGLSFVFQQENDAKHLPAV